MNFTIFRRALTEMKSKIGIHSIRTGPTVNFCKQMAEQGTPVPVVLSVDRPTLAQEIHDVSPQTFVITRLTGDHLFRPLLDALPSVDEKDIANSAWRYFREKTVLAELRYANAVNFMNEWDWGPDNPSGYHKMGLVSRHMAELARQDGLNYAHLALNCGTPEWDELNALVESGMFDHAKNNKGILLLHEGVFNERDPISLWWPAMSPFGQDIRGAGWLCLRYRILYEGFLKPKNLVIPLVISEFYAGGKRSDIPDTMARLDWYNGEINSDDYVIGVCPFTVGPTEQWANENYEPIYAGAVQEYALRLLKENPPPAETPNVPEVPPAVPEPKPNLMGQQVLVLRGAWLHEAPVMERGEMQAGLVTTFIPWGTGFRVLQHERDWIRVTDGGIANGKPFEAGWLHESVVIRADYLDRWLEVKQ